IDPENALYKPGGVPAAAQHPAGAPLTEPLGASTMPQSVLPSPSQFERAKAEMEAQQHHAEAVDSGSSVDLDLDLDLAATAAVAAAASKVAAQPLPAREPQRQHREPEGTMSFDPVKPQRATVAVAAAAAPSSDF